MVSCWRNGMFSPRIFLFLAPPFFDRKKDIPSYCMSTGCRHHSEQAPYACTKQKKGRDPKMRKKVWCSEGWRDGCIGWDECESLLQTCRLYNHKNRCKLRFFIPQSPYIASLETMGNSSPIYLPYTTHLPWTLDPVYIEIFNELCNLLGDPLDSIQETKGIVDQAVVLVSLTDCD